MSAYIVGNFIIHNLSAFTERVRVFFTSQGCE
jgi:hypothetical protein